MRLICTFLHNPFALGLSKSEIMCVVRQAHHARCLMQAHFERRIKQAHHELCIKQAHHARVTLK